MAKHPPEMIRRAFEQEVRNPRSGRVLRVGTRVRHNGERYPEALEHGTGNVVALLHKPDSAWSRSYRAPDIELVVLSDRPRFDTRLSRVAHYHVEVIERNDDG